MRRIDHSTRAASIPAIPAASTEGYFTAGDPVAGTPATVIPDWWLNMVQEELRNTVTAAGLTPSKTVWTQLRDAIRALPEGRLIGFQVFGTTGSATYTPTPGTNSVVVEVQGAGGGGGGAPTTGAGQVSMGAGGESGAFGRGRYTSGFAGVAVTVGAGGAGVSGAAGANGGTSSFGALLSAPGGRGGGIAAPTAAPWNNGMGTLGSIAVGGTVTNSRGETGGNAVMLSNAAGWGGRGGTAVLGAGAPESTPNANAAGAGGRGGGGGGAANGENQAARTGGAGGDGLVIVWEYS